MKGLDTIAWNSWGDKPRKPRL